MNRSADAGIHSLNSNESFHISLSLEEQEKINDQVNYLIAMFAVYALIVIVLLVLRIKPYARYQKERIDCEKAEHLLRDMEEQTVTRNILEQLKNSEFRDKA